MDFTIIEKTFGYQFKNRDLLKEALTHRSYLNERPEWGISHNERLEFLGDAVIELVVTEEIYNRFPDYEEGVMTSFRAALVNYLMLAHVARTISLESFVLLSKGEAKDKGRAREVILANAFEALVGAMYLDGGYAPVKKFLLSTVFPELDNVIKQGLYKDAKSELQEKAQGERKVTPTYRVLEETGPDHDKVFRVGVFFGDQQIAEGRGASKQDAEVEAAKEALKVL